MNFTKMAAVSGAFFFVFMFLFMKIISPITAKEPINFDGIWTDVIILGIFSIIYGLFMAKFVWKPQTKEKNQ